MTIDHKSKFKRPISQRLREFWILHGKDARNTAIIVIGCIAFSAILFEPREKVGYERAIIDDFGVREGSNTPGVRLWVRTNDGKRRLINSRAYMPGLKKGSEICLLRTRGTLRKQTYLEPVLPSRCTDLAPTAQEI